MAETVAIIGQATFIRGSVRGDGDLNVAGRIEGNIELSGEVVFEESALIKSSVSARRIVVRGAIAGDLTATEAIVLEAGARVVGDLSAARVSIDEGALFRGRIEMSDGAAHAKPAKTAARSEPRPAPAARVAEAPVAAVPRQPDRVQARPVAPIARVMPPPRPAPEPVAAAPQPAPPAATPAPRAVAARAPMPPARRAPEPPRAPASRVVAVADAAAPAVAAQRFDVPPPPVVPSLKKKAKGSLRKRAEE